MADCDFCNLGDCIWGYEVRKFETMVMLTIKASMYACAIAAGVMLGIGFADSITANGFNNAAVLLPVQIAAGTFVGGFTTVAGLVIVADLLNL